MSSVIWPSGMTIARLRPACLKNHARPNFADLRVQSSVIFCYRDGVRRGDGLGEKEPSLSSIALIAKAITPPLPG